MLNVQNLTLHYGQSQILHGIDLEAQTGKVTCIMGTNGVGKTSLLNAISGTHPRSGGDMSLDGEDLGRLPAHQLAQKGIGYVPQGHEIFPQLTVEENLQIGLGARKNRQRNIPARVFELFPALKQMLQRRGGDLSGGQQQQLAIGRALVLEPKLLILDEATEGIQPNIVHEIGDIILRLNEEAGVTVLLVEQKLPFARRVASEFRILDKGRSVAGGAISELNDNDIREHLTV